MGVFDLRGIVVGTSTRLPMGLIIDEFILNLVGQGLLKYFQEDFENFMGMFLSCSSEISKKKKKGKQVRENPY